MPLKYETYDSDSSEGDSPKPQRKANNNNNPPKFDDNTAYPQTLGGVAAPAVPSGVNYAGLAGKFVPEEPQNEFDLTQPRPLQRRTNRIARLKDMYYKTKAVGNQPLGKTWSLFVDSGLTGPEQSAECDSKLLGTIDTTRKLDPLISPVRAGLSTGSNVRLFKANFSSPSALDENLAKGGKWAIAVSKELSRDMFEELFLYVLDERLGFMVDGCVYAVRDGVDVLQIWTRINPSTEQQQQMSDDLIAILGLESGFPIKFQLHGSNKASKVRMYYCVESVPAACVRSQEFSLQPRSKSEITPREKKDRKKDKGKKPEDDFIGVTQRKPRNHTSISYPSEAKEEQVSSTTSSNPFGNLEVENESTASKKSNKQPKEEQEEPLRFNRKKPPSRKGSKKDKKKTDEFADLPVQQGSVVPLPVFMAGGAGIILVLSFLIWSYLQQSS